MGVVLDAARNRTYVSTPRSTVAWWRSTVQSSSRRLRLGHGPGGSL